MDGSVFVRFPEPAEPEHDREWALPLGGHTRQAADGDGGHRERPPWWGQAWAGLGRSGLGIGGETGGSEGNDQAEGQ